MRLIPALFSAAGLLCLAGSAQAEGTLGTARHGNLEIRYAPYRPDIDSQFSLPAGCEDQGPYSRFYGSGDDGLLLLGYEGHLMQKYGTLSAGGDIGYFRVAGKAQAGLPCRPTGSGVATGAAEAEADTDESSLIIVPLQAQVSYRLTIWEDMIPVVPVLRLGLDYYMWRMGNTSGDVASFESGQEASGGTWGWHYTVGLHLLLDFFSEAMAADFDRDAGVNSTYLTVEYMHAQVDDFGSKKSIRLGDSTLVFGLGFDM
jgi:hypothetical protein